MKNTTYFLITGASSGIGKAIACEVAGKGFNLALVALPNTGLLNVASQIQQEYEIQIHCLEIDLTDENASQTIEAWIVKEKIQLQYLVNNAGLGYASPFTNVKVELLSKLMKLNNQSVVELTHRLLPILMHQESAGILNVCSLASWYPVPNKSIYAASKAFLMSFSRSLNYELKQHHIHVTCLCPGATPTSDAVKQRMKEGGWLHYLFASKVATVAKKSVKGLIRKKQVVIPNLADQLVLIFSRIIPLNIRIAVTGKILGFGK